MKTSWWSVGCIVGMALTGAALILLIPSLFDSSDGPVEIVVVLACVTVAFGAGARFSRSR